MSDYQILQQHEANDYVAMLSINYQQTSQLAQLEEEQNKFILSNL